MTRRKGKILFLVSLFILFTFSFAYCEEEIPGGLDASMGEEDVDPDGFEQVLSNQDSQSGFEGVGAGLGSKGMRWVKSMLRLAGAFGI